MIKQLLFLKLCWNRANSHIGIVMSIAEKVILVSIFLKIFELNNYFLIALFGLLFIIAMFMIGYLDLRSKIYEQEQSLNNKHNVEIQKLLKK